jgi:hypothetical protein
MSRNFNFEKSNRRAQCFRQGTQDRKVDDNAGEIWLQGHEAGREAEREEARERNWERLKEEARREKELECQARRRRKRKYWGHYHHASNYADPNRGVVSATTPGPGFKPYDGEKPPFALRPRLPAWVHEMED